MEFIGWVQSIFQGFLDSYFFAALQWFMGVYSAVLVINIVILVFFRNPIQLLRQGSYGTTFVPSVSQSAMRKKWSAIETRLNSGNISEYKVAVLEADGIVDGILNDIGYAGNDMTQKIEQLRAVQPHDAECLDEAHRIRNRIVFEEDFQIDLAETKRILGIFQEYLKKLDYFAE
jgi:glycogen synthase